jgi:phosphinothricin acetyltransferase
MIRQATRQDADQIAAIYNYYVERTVITFEEELVTAAEMAERIARVSAAHPWMVLEEGQKLCGYAYATRWRERAAYRHSVESTVYLAPECKGRGLGTILYTALIGRLRSAGVHCVLGGIALPNAASVALHEKLGFRQVADLKEVGQKLDRWVDVGYWELIL